MAIPVSRGDVLVVAHSFSDRVYSYRDARLGTVYGYHDGSVHASWGHVHTLPVGRRRVSTMHAGDMLQVTTWHPAVIRRRSTTLEWLLAGSVFDPFRELCPSAPLTSLFGRGVQLHDGKDGVLVGLRVQMQRNVGLTEEDSFDATMSLIVRIDEAHARVFPSWTPVVLLPQRELVCSP